MMVSVNDGLPIESEMRASKQAESAVDSAIAAALKELNDESEGYNIADCDGSESVTVQVGSEVDEAEDRDYGAESQPDQSGSIVESDVISVVSGVATEADNER
ncbi:hypothetical protein PInf_022010 [Phytophthora infestans]|nr:hypothetical protein PInf_022010 [Phytophthora infestans]